MEGCSFSTNPHQRCGCLEGSPQKQSAGSPCKSAGTVPTHPHRFLQICLKLFTFPETLLALKTWNAQPHPQLRPSGSYRKYLEKIPSTKETRPKSPPGNEQMNEFVEIPIEPQRQGSQLGHKLDRRSSVLKAEWLRRQWGKASRSPYSLCSSLMNWAKPVVLSSWTGTHTQCGGPQSCRPQHLSSSHPQIPRSTCVCLQHFISFIWNLFTTKEKPTSDSWTFLDQFSFTKTPTTKEKWMKTWPVQTSSSSAMPCGSFHTEAGCVDQRQRTRAAKITRICIFPLSNTACTTEQARKQLKDLVFSWKNCTKAGKKNPRIPFQCFFPCPLFLHCSLSPHDLSAVPTELLVSSLRDFTLSYNQWKILVVRCNKG